MSKYTKHGILFAAIHTVFFLNLAFDFTYFY